MMYARTVAVRIPETRRWNWAACALILFAIAATAARMGEIPGHPLALLRVLGSMIAIGFLAFGPVASLGRRAFVVVALEAVFGIATFALVDVPFVVDHRPQIGAFTAVLVERLDRVEHGRI